MTTTPGWNSQPQTADPCAGVGLPCGRSIEMLKNAPWFPTSVSVIGRALLARVVCLYDYFGVPLPERRVWVAGEVPFDCNQLVVSLDSLSEGLVASEGQPPNPCEVPVNATFNVTVVRCHPVDPKGAATKPEILAGAADAAAIDAYLLMKLSGCLDMYGTDTGGVNLGGMGTEASVSISSAQGGVQSVTLSLTTVVG